MTLLVLKWLIWDYRCCACVNTLGWFQSVPSVCLIYLDSTCHVCLCLATAPLSPVELHWACSVLWSDWLAPFVPQLLTDLSEFVDLTSPAAPASAQTQRLPPKPPPTAVGARAASALLVSGCADRPVRTREASSMSAACSLTGPGNLTRAAAWMDMYDLRTNDPISTDMSR